MAGRFDPVRDSVISPPERYRELAVEDTDQSHSGASPIEREGDESLRQRRPSRSASIAGILNDDEGRPGSSRSQSTGFGSGPGGTNGSGWPSRHLGSSPSSSSVRLPPSLSPSSHSPKGYRMELSGYHDDQRFSSDNGRPPSLRRQSSSHSATSSTEYYGQAPSHHSQSSMQKPQRSPSVLHLLNSDAPPPFDDGKRLPSSTTSSTDLRPRSRGPSFAGGLSILSPTNESVGSNGRAGSVSSHLRYDSINQSPIQRTTAPSPHPSHGISRQTSISGNQSYFAIPDVPSRSPEVMRGRRSLPNISPEVVHSSIPSHHLTPSDMDLRDVGARHPSQSVGAAGYFASTWHGQPPTPGPYHSDESPGSRLPHHHSSHLQPSMEIQPSSGSFGASSHPLTPTGVHSRLEEERLAGKPGSFSTYPQPLRQGMERERSWSKMSQSSGHSPSVEHGSWVETPAREGREAFEDSLPSVKRRRESTDSRFGNEGAEMVQHREEERVQEAAMTSLDRGTSTPKRGRSKARLPVSHEGGVVMAQVEPAEGQSRTMLKAEVEQGRLTAAHRGLETESSGVKLEESLGAAQQRPEAEAVVSDSTAASAPLPLTSIGEETKAIRAPQRARVAYKPVARVSVPTTIRVPVTSTQVDEMRFQCQNSLRSRWQESNPSTDDGWSLVVSNFASQISQAVERGPSGDSVLEKKRKRAEAEDSNARLVAQHYNARQDQGLGARKQSPILPLRNFNNWTKSVIIGSFGKRGGRVLDLGGGKGGDLNKWDKAGVSEYVLCDIASVSVEQAEGRYREKKTRFLARFFSFDCFSEPLADNIPPSLLEPGFDNVSLQFCLHYGWESVQKAQLMLENIARYLKPGAVFVGTLPNADLLRSKLAVAMESSPSTMSFGNSYYNVRFEPSTNAKGNKFPLFGHKYYFTLVDAVDDVAEYVVDWDQFVSIAQQNGLECIYKKTFEQVWREEGQVEQFRNLSRKMRITPDGGPNGIPMNEDLWEATGLYLAFAFEKKLRP